MLTALNTFCMVLGYTTLFYLICCVVCFLWIYKSYTEERKRDLNIDKVPISNYIELFFTTPPYFISETILIIKDIKNEYEHNNEK